MNRILVTDSLFIGPQEEQMLMSAGYEIDRLDLPAATEEQLIEAIRGKVGYILGGVETVTDAVIDAADQLRAISFTGSGYTEFIPAWRRATERGIAISAARGANARAVAEFTVAAAVAQVRQLPNLMTPGGSSFAISREFEELTVGIVGYGEIGRSAAEKYKALGFRVLATTPAPDPGVTGSTLEQIVAEADVVSVHVNKDRGEMVLDATAIASLKEGVIVVNTAFREAIDNEALVERLRLGTLRAAVDYPLTAGSLPIGALLSSNGQTAFNTREANKRTSIRATASLLSLLAEADDADLVNPDFRNYI